jgi:hypothetical protein
MEELREGIQLKRKVTIVPFNSNSDEIWYVKTHAGGLLNDTK